MQSGRAYPLSEIQKMLEVLPEPARTVILTAALTGMRGSEIRGLKWTDFNGTSLDVQRSVWRKHVGDTKTPGSAAPIPVIPVLAKALEFHRQTNPGPYIFCGGTGEPLVLANLIRRVIKPKLAEAGISFSGLHGFSRGLATTLIGLGVADVVTQQILRHASVEVTRKHYIKTSSVQAESAMKKLAKSFLRLGDIVAAESIGQNSPRILLLGHSEIRADAWPVFRKICLTEFVHTTSECQETQPRH